MGLEPMPAVGTASFLVGDRGVPGLESLQFPLMGTPKAVLGRRSPLYVSGPLAADHPHFDAALLTATKDSTTYGSLLVVPMFLGTLSRIRPAIPC